MRLRPYEPEENVKDISPIDKKQFITDPSLGKYRGEPELFDSQLQYVDNIQDTLVPNTNIDEETTAPETEVTGMFPGNPAVPAHGASLPPAVEAAVPAFPVEPLNEQNDDLEPLHFRNWSQLT